MEKPNYILKFQEGVMAPKKESLAKDMVKLLLAVFTVLFLVLVLLFGPKVLKEVPLITWVCVIFACGYLKSQGGYEKKPSPCELRFYDDYIVQYCERRYYNRKNIRKEYYKFYYKDITRFLYRVNLSKFDIFGLVEAEFYKYDKSGQVKDAPDKRVKAKSVSVFYTVFEPDINFVKEIEEHSPVKIEYEN